MSSSEGSIRTRWSPKGNRRRGFATAGALLVSVMVATGCGSELSDRQLTAQAREAFTAAPAASSADAAEPAPAEAAAGESPSATEAPSTETAVGSAAGQGGASNPAQSRSAGTAPGNAASAGAVGAGAPRPAGSAKSAVAGPGAAATGTAPGGGAVTTTTAPVGGSKSPVVLGSIGAQSGVVGQVLAPTLQGARAWVADVNARGGLAGHPVRLVVGDDGSDPGRALSLAKRMIEQDRALALYADMMGLTLQAVTPYLEQQQVPLVGGCTCNGNAGESPMVFYVGSYPGEGLNWAHILPLTNYTKHRKVSVIWCREAPACQSIRDGVRKIAAQAGINIVHDAQVSLAQPDFTGEVLAAQSAGAEAILAATDNFSIARIARAAHRQNYDPAIVGQWSAHDERFLSTGGKDIEGVYISGAMPDWNSPKLAEYRSVLDRHVPGAAKASLSMAAWAAGKLLEVVAPGLPPNPTPQDLVKALYKVNGETLGGLVPPLAYREGQRHADSNACSVPFQVKDGKFVAKNGDNWLCPPGWQPVQK